MNTFTIRSPKGRECRIGIRKEYSHDQLCAMKKKLLGVKWLIIWQSMNGFFTHRLEWMDFIEDRKAEDTIDELFDKYGNGKLWGFYEEVVTKV